MLVNFCGVGIALEMLLTAEPIDAQRALQINLVSKLVPHEKLMETAEAVAKAILRNDQAAVRSAKQVTLDMIGRNLDDQLYKEAYASYTLMANPRCRACLSDSMRRRTREGTGPTRRPCNHSDATHCLPRQLPSIAEERRRSRITKRRDAIIS